MVCVERGLCEVWSVWGCGVCVRCGVCGTWCV